MASTGTGINRTRSLRKPNPTTSSGLLSRNPPSTASSTSTSTSTSTLTHAAATSAAPTAAAVADRNVSPSRLPGPRLVSRSIQPPASTTTTSAVPNANASTTNPLRRNRPGGGSISTRAPQVTSTSRTQPPTETTAARTAGPPRQLRPRYPPNASNSGTGGANPPASTAGSIGTTSQTNGSPRRPTSSGGLTSNTSKPRAGPGHARAKSTVTASSTAPTSTNGGLFANAPALRPPTTPTTATKPRPLSLHSRAPPATETERPNPSRAPTTTTASTKAPVAALPPHLAKKPTFSTLQQHYSPLRKTGPKPLTATYLAPPSPSKRPANVAASAETSRLQTELLQLHLLHRDAPATDAAWRASARRALEARHADLVSRSRDVRDAEVEAAERINVAALHDWAGPNAGTEALEHKIQMLDGILAGLWGLDGPSGRYTRVTRRFDRWCERMAEVDGMRRDASGSRDRGASLLLDLDGDGAGDVIVGGLEHAWKDEVAGLVRKLDGWRRQLRDLGDVPPGQDGSPSESSLARTLRGCQSLVHDMLAELSIMAEMERAAVEKEMEWVRNMNREEDSATRHDNTTDTPSVGAIWRTL